MNIVECKSRSKEYLNTLISNTNEINDITPVLNKKKDEQEQQRLEKKEQENKEEEELNSILLQYAGITGLSKSGIGSVINLLGCLLEMPKNLNEGQVHIDEMNEYFNVVYKELKDIVDRLKRTLEKPNMYMNPQKTLEWSTENLPEHFHDFISKNSYNLNDMVDLMETPEDYNEEFPKNPLTNFAKKKILEKLSAVTDWSNNIGTSLTNEISVGESMVKPLLNWSKSLNTVNENRMLTGPTIEEV